MGERKFERGGNGTILVTWTRFDLQQSQWLIAWYFWREEWWCTKQTLLTLTQMEIIEKDLECICSANLVPSWYQRMNVTDLLQQSAVWTFYKGFVTRTRTYYDDENYDPNDNAKKWIDVWDRKRIEGLIWFVDMIFEFDVGSDTCTTKADQTIALKYDTISLLVHCTTNTDTHSMIKCGLIHNKRKRIRER